MMLQKKKRSAPSYFENKRECSLLNFSSSRRNNLLFILNFMGKIIGLVVIVGIAVAGYLFLQSDRSMPTKTENNTVSQETSSLGTNDSVKEFTTTAYYDETGVWFSLKEMRVKKGDLVRIHATNTKGMHDFVIDEFGIKKELPMNEEVTFEFTADKAGEFIFYCSKPGHKAKGQWGTLIVE